MKFLWAACILVRSRGMEQLLSIPPSRHVQGFTVLAGKDTIVDTQ